MKSKEFIEQLKMRCQLPSNYAAARLLGITDSRISAYMRGRREFNDETAIKVAGLLDLPDGFVLAEIQSERAKTDELRQAWRTVARSVLELAQKGAAVVVITALGLGVMSPGQGISAAGPAAGELTLYTLYACRRRWIGIRVCLGGLWARAAAVLVCSFSTMESGHARA